MKTVLLSLLSLVLSVLTPALSSAQDCTQCHGPDILEGYTGSYDPPSDPASSRAMAAVMLTFNYCPSTRNDYPHRFSCWDCHWGGYMGDGLTNMGPEAMEALGNGTACTCCHTGGYTNQDEAWSRMHDYGEEGPPSTRQELSRPRVLVFPTASSGNAVPAAGAVISSQAVLEFPMALFQRSSHAVFSGEGGLAGRIEITGPSGYRKIMDGMSGLGKIEGPVVQWDLSGAPNGAYTIIITPRRPSTGETGMPLLVHITLNIADGGMMVNVLENNNWSDPGNPARWSQETNLDTWGVDASCPNHYTKIRYVIPGPMDVVQLRIENIHDPANPALVYQDEDAQVRDGYFNWDGRRLVAGDADRSRVLPGLYQVTVSVNGSPYQGSPKILLLGPDPLKSTVKVENEYIVAGGEKPATFTVTLKDGEGQSLVGRSGTDWRFGWSAKLTSGNLILMAEPSGDVFKAVFQSGEPGDYNFSALAWRGSSKSFSICAEPAPALTLTGFLTAQGNTPIFSCVSAHAAVVKVDSVDIDPSDPETNKIASVLSSGRDHYVCVKNTGDVVLKATVTPSVDVGAITWEADGATITSPAVGNDRASAKLPSAVSQKIPVRLKVGSHTFWEGTVWVIWSSLTANFTAAQVSSIDGTPLGLHGGRNYQQHDYHVSAGIDWTGTISPAAIITDTDRPGIEKQTRDLSNLAGDSNGVAGAGNLDKTGSGFSGWDISRQKRRRAQKGNPDKVPPVPIYDTTASDVEGIYQRLDYPASDVEGNDDGSVGGDEDSNPYAQQSGPPSPPGSGSTGTLRSNDEPKDWFFDYQGYDGASSGVDGDTVRRHFQAREFVRVQLGDKWYRCSDWGDWRWHYHAKRLTGAWNLEPTRTDLVDSTNNDFEY